VNTQIVEDSTHVRKIREILPTLEYKAVFIPQSKSRNKDATIPTLNWRICLSNPPRRVTTFETDYQQGIGHIPKCQQTHSPKAKTVNLAQYERQVAESGKYSEKIQMNSLSLWLPLPKPNLVDVLSCLVLECDTLNYPGFEDWAMEFGYDSDSRKTKHLYQKCLDVALRFKYFVGGETVINQLEEALRNC